MSRPGSGPARRTLPTGRGMPVPLGDVCPHEGDEGRRLIHHNRQRQRRSIVRRRPSTSATAGSACPVAPGFFMCEGTPARCAPPCFPESPAASVIQSDGGRAARPTNGAAVTPARRSKAQFRAFGPAPVEAKAPFRPAHRLTRCQSNSANIRGSISDDGLGLCPSTSAERSRPPYRRRSRRLGQRSRYNFPTSSNGP